MIYVSHRLDEIFRIADRVAVLRDGMMVGIRDVAHTTPEELVQLIVGRRAREFDRPEADKGASVLSLSNVVIGDVGPVDLKVNQGEVVGLLGLRGAGHEDVGRCLFGERSFTGDIALNGKAPDLSSPRAAMQSGIGLLARDRVVESIAPVLTIRENMFMNPLASGRGMFSFKGTGAEETEVETIGQSLGLSPNDPTLAIEALSGGNQQKVVVGRWLETDPAIAHRGRPDSRCRCRRQGGNLRAFVRGACQRHGRSRRVDGFRGSGCDLPPGHRLQPWAGGNRTDRRRPVYRIPYPGRLGQRSRR